MDFWQGFQTSFLSYTAQIAASIVNFLVTPQAPSAPSFCYLYCAHLRFRPKAISVLVLMAVNSQDFGTARILYEV